MPAKNNRNNSRESGIVMRCHLEESLWKLTQGSGQEINVNIAIKKNFDYNCLT